MTELYCLDLPFYRVGFLLPEFWFARVVGVLTLSLGLSCVLFAGVSQAISLRHS